MSPQFDRSNLPLWDASGDGDWLIKSPAYNRERKLFASLEENLPKAEKKKERGKRMVWGVTQKGGPGSGNFGHAGRPGKVGGSAGTDQPTLPGLTKFVGGKVPPQTIEETIESRAFKRWFGASKVVDWSGKPLLVYHGTTHDLDEFDLESHGDPENYWGAGHYFTDGLEDVNSNYAGYGPDLNQKIGGKVDDIAQAYSDDPSSFIDEISKITGDDPEVVQEHIDNGDLEDVYDTESIVQTLARNEVAGEHGGAIIPAFLKMNRPLVLDDVSHEPTVFNQRSFTKLRESMLDVADDWGFDRDDIEQAWAEVAESNDFGEGGVFAKDVFDELRSNEKLLYLEGEWRGDYKSMYAQFLGDVVRRMGYDGIIMNAGEAFPRMTGTYGVCHYILWEPTHIKSPYNMTFDPKNPKINRGMKETNMRNTTKGGPGSGNFGHQGRPGKVGGSADDGGVSAGQGRSGNGEISAGIDPGRAETRASFNKAEWEALSMDERRKKFFGQPRDVWMAQADAKHSIPRAQNEIMSMAGQRPNSGDVREDVKQRVKQLLTFVPRQNAAIIEDTALEMADIFDQCGSDPEVTHRLVMEAVDTLAAQDYESLGRTLGDHGIAHLRGNIDAAMQIVQAVPGADTAQTYAEIYITNIWHDAGYLTDPARSFLDSGHKDWSQEHYDENIAPLVEEALGVRTSRKISSNILTHDSTNIDWETDPVGTAVRVADNIALFQKEKLPGLFRFVPQNVDLLEKLGTGQIDVQTAQSQMIDNINGTSLAPKVKESLIRAAREVNPKTHKFTLGMLGGSLDGVEWATTTNDGQPSPGHLRLILRKNKEATRLNRLLDLGQRQFAKLVEAYDVPWSQFKRHLGFQIPGAEKGLPVLMEGVQVGEKEAQKQALREHFKRALKQWRRA